MEAWSNAQLDDSLEYRKGRENNALDTRTCINFTAITLCCILPPLSFSYIWVSGKGKGKCNTTCYVHGKVIFRCHMPPAPKATGQTNSWAFLRGSFRPPSFFLSFTDKVKHRANPQSTFTPTLSDSGWVDSITPVKTSVSGLLLTCPCQIVPSQLSMCPLMPLQDNEWSAASCLQSFSLFSFPSFFISPCPSS